MTDWRFEWTKKIMFLVFFITDIYYKQNSIYGLYFTNAKYNILATLFIYFSFLSLFKLKINKNETNKKACLLACRNDIELIILNNPTIQYQICFFNK